MSTCHTQQVEPVHEAQIVDTGLTAISFYMYVACLPFYSNNIKVAYNPITT